MDLRPTIDDASSAKTRNPEGWSGLTLWLRCSSVTELFGAMLLRHASPEGQPIPARPLLDLVVLFFPFSPDKAPLEKLISFP